MSQSRVLIVHSEPSILALLGSMLQSLGHQIDEATTDRAAVRRLERGGVDVMIAGINPADPEAMELVSYARRKHHHVSVILLFPAAHPERAREAIRLGATTVLKFPMPATELRAAVTQACERSRSVARPEANGTNGVHGVNGTATPSAPRRLDDDVRGLNGITAPRALAGGAPRGSEPAARGDQATVAPGLQLVGDDPTFCKAASLAGTVAPSRLPVLIVGEQGTGKTLVARLIHQQSGRGDQPFVEVSCEGIDELGLERELFGQRFEEDPASERPGRIARAHGGTVVLDEVGALSSTLQSKLLQVIRDGVVEPLGSSQSYPIDVRFILSTRENLASLVEQGKFRRDLLERINDICLKLPPLAQRGEDIMSLADFFRERANREFGKAATGFTHDATELLTRHPWPGNVRELESVVQRGVALSQGARVNAANLAVGINPGRSARPAPGYNARFNAPGVGLRPLKEALEEPEKQIIIQALRALNWNRQETARVLDINRTTLYKKMKKYGLLIEEPALIN